MPNIRYESSFDKGDSQKLASALSRSVFAPIIVGVLLILFSFGLLFRLVSDGLHYVQNCKLSSDQISDIRSQAVDLGMNNKDVYMSDFTDLSETQKAAGSSLVSSVRQDFACFGTRSADGNANPYWGFQQENSKIYEFLEVRMSTSFDQTLTAGNSNESQNSQITDSSLGSPSNSLIPIPEIEPEATQWTPSPTPRKVKWVPTISAIKFCVNNQSDPSCPGQPGVQVSAVSTFSVDGKAIIQRLIDKGFCQPNLSNGETGPSGSDGEWLCFAFGDSYTVWTGDKMIADKMYVRSYQKKAALDGALFFGPLQDDVIEFLGATLVDG